MITFNFVRRRSSEPNLNGNLATILSPILSSSLIAMGNAKYCQPIFSQSKLAENSSLVTTFLLSINSSSALNPNLRLFLKISAFSLWSSALLILYPVLRSDGTNAESAFAHAENTY